MQQAGNHLQIVLDPVMNFPQQYLLLGEGRLDGSLQPTTLAAIPNVALYHESLARLIGVADELDIDHPLVTRFERQVIVADVALGL